MAHQDAYSMLIGEHGTSLNISLASGCLFLINLHYRFKNRFIFFGELQPTGIANLSCG